MSRIIAGAIALFFTVLLTQTSHPPQKAGLPNGLSCQTDCLAPMLDTNRGSNAQQLLEKFIARLQKNGRIAKNKSINDMPIGELNGWLDLFNYLQVVCSNNEDLIFDLLDRAMMGRVPLLEQAPRMGMNMPKRVIPYTPVSTYSTTGNPSGFDSLKIPPETLELFESETGFNSIAVVADSVFVDGLGDIVHVVEMAKALMRKYPSKDIKIYLPRPPAKEKVNHIDEIAWQERYINFVKNSGISNQTVWFENAQYERQMLFADAKSLKASGIYQDVVLQMPCPPMVLGIQYYPPKTKVILSLSEYYGASELFYNKRVHLNDNADTQFVVRYTSGTFPNMGFLFPEPTVQKALDVKQDIADKGKTACRVKLLNTLLRIQLQDLVNYDLGTLPDQGQLADAVKEQVVNAALEEHKTGRRGLVEEFLKSCQDQRTARKFIANKVSAKNLRFNKDQFLQALQNTAQNMLEKLSPQTDFNAQAQTDWFFAYSTYAASIETTVRQKFKSENPQATTLFTLCPAYPYELLGMGIPRELYQPDKPMGILNIVQMKFLPKELFLELMFLSDDIVSTGDHSTVEALTAAAVFNDKLLNFETRAHKATLIMELLLNMQINLERQKTYTKANVYTFAYEHSSKQDQQAMRNKMGQSAAKLMKQSNLFATLERILNHEWEQVNRLDNFITAHSELTSAA